MGTKNVVSRVGSEGTRCSGRREDTPKLVFSQGGGGRIICSEKMVSCIVNLPSDKAVLLEFASRRLSPEFSRQEL